VFILGRHGTTLPYFSYKWVLILKTFHFHLHTSKKMNFLQNFQVGYNLSTDLGITIKQGISQERNMEIEEEAKEGYIYIVIHNSCTISKIVYNIYMLVTHMLYDSL
jgi:hypothetical protein